MSDVNHVILIGRLFRDAERRAANGPLNFSIAVNRRVKHGESWVEEAEYFDIVLWGRSGESLNQYLVKGKQVAVEGELHQNRWEQDGQPRSKIEIIANNVQLLGGNANSQGSGSPGHTGGAASGGSAAPYQKRPSQPSSGPTDTDDSVPPDFPDDIPF
jgi:single-strand DNA-binding protein